MLSLYHSVGTAATILLLTLSCSKCWRGPTPDNISRWGEASAPADTTTSRRTPTRTICGVRKDASLNNGHHAAEYRLCYSYCCLCYYYNCYNTSTTAATTIITTLSSLLVNIVIRNGIHFKRSDFFVVVIIWVKASHLALVLQLHTNCTFLAVKQNLSEEETKKMLLSCKKL